MSPASGTAAPALVGAGERAFLLRKLHSLSGVVPVGAFLIVHLWTNARLLAGRGSFDEGVRHIQELPGLPLVEVFGILLPLAFHAGYGVKLALEARPNVGRYPYARNWTYVAQRATGLVALAFVLYHLWELRIQKALGKLAATGFYDTLAAHLSSTWSGVPLVAIAYLVGVGASVFHLANGVWGFAASWGLVVSRSAQRSLAVACALFGFALFAIGAQTALALATGANPFHSTQLPDTCTTQVPVTAPPAR